MKKNEDIWVDKEGKEHRLCYMSNTYLLNIINYLESVIKREFSDFNQVVCATWYVYPIYKNMIEEALSRNFGENMKNTLQSKQNILSSCGYDIVTEDYLNHFDQCWEDNATIFEADLRIKQKKSKPKIIKRQIDLD